jgi:SSS family solute:Na+ symporter
VRQNTGEDSAEPYINPASTSEQSLRAVRWATIWFAMLMIIVASITSYLVIVYPNVRIIPIALGIFGYTYGSLLGVFSVEFSPNGAATISATSSR